VVGTAARVAAVFTVMVAVPDAGTLTPEQVIAVAVMSQVPPVTVAVGTETPAGRLPIGMVTVVVASDGPWLVTVIGVVTVLPATRTAGVIEIDPPSLLAGWAATRAPEPDVGSRSMSRRSAC
jgi:hypothetical protein